MVDFHEAIARAAAKVNEATNETSNANETMPSNDPAPIWRCVVCGEVHPAEDGKVMLILRSSSKTYLKWEVCQSCAPQMRNRLNDMAKAIEEKECQ